MSYKIIAALSTLAVLTAPMVIGGVAQAAVLIPTSHFTAINTPTPPSSPPAPPAPPATGSPVGQGGGAPPAAFPLTLGQLQQTISTVNDDMMQSSNGTVSVDSSILQQAGLSNAEISWTQQAMAAYDYKITSGQIQPVLGAAEAYSVTQSRHTAATMMRSNSSSTYGLDYTWYVARTPYWYTDYPWWGTSQMGNNTATKNLVSNLTAISASAGVAALFPWEGSWIVGLGGLVVGGYASQISSTNTQGGNFGVHINFVFGNPIPVGIYYNVP